MLSKCANPTCIERFLYLSHGKIFNIEIVDMAFHRRDPRAKRIEHFWLCERCAQTMKVVFANGMVTTRPLFLQLPPARVREAQPRRIA